MLNALASGLVLAGAGVLLAALSPARTKWLVLGALIGVFILGYLGFAALNWGRPADGAQMIVPAIFYLGACFVWVNASLALQTAADVRRVSRLEYENITDPLTGTFNRRQMQRQFEQEFSRARRYGQPLTILLLDIDHFKRVNNQHGLQVGDLVLRRLGQLTQNAVREADSVSRYGGEEFLVISPSTAAAGMLTLAERIPALVAAEEFRLGGDEHLKVTVSIGAAGFDASLDSVDALVKLADEALYRAKHEGRNRVVTGQSLASGSAG